MNFLIKTELAGAYGLLAGKRTEPGYATFTINKRRGQSQDAGLTIKSVGILHEVTCSHATWSRYLDPVAKRLEIVRHFG